MEQAFRQATNTRKRPARKPGSAARRRRAARNRKIAIISICTCVLVVVIGLIAGIFLTPEPETDDGRILKNVCAGGINLGGMTKEEAKSALRLATNNTFTMQDMVIELPDATLTLSPADTGAKLDVDAVVEAAYSYGRTGSEADRQQAQTDSLTTVHTIALLPYLDLDLPFIQNTIRDFCNSYSSTMTQPTVTLSGTRPTYDPEYPDLVVSHQTLVVTMGTPDYELDASKLYDRVLDAYSLNELEVIYKAPTLTEPEIPDAAKLFKEYCISPADATIDDVTYEVTPEIYGYGFNIGALQTMIDDAEYGDTIEISLDFIMPNVTAAELADGLFLDMLSSYISSNQYGNSTGRTTNLRLSCETINGIVLKPGDVFSFNEIIGRPTAEKGYKKASDFRNGQVVDILGGGLSQTASTLYYCALMADLEILERSCNYFQVNYVPMGMDAFINYGISDLRFRNNTESPIRILASSEGGQVTIQLIGVDELDYDIQIKHEVIKEERPQTTTQIMAEDNVMGYKDGDVLQNGLIGYEVETYMYKYDRITGQQIDKILVNTSVYNKRDQIVVKIGTDEPLPTDPTVPSEPTDPSVDPSDPSVDPSEPSVDPSEPSVDPSEPSTDPTAASDPTGPTQSTEPSVDPSAPTEAPTDPSAPTGDTQPTAEGSN